VTRLYPVTRNNALVNGWSSRRWSGERWSRFRFADAWVDPGPSPMGNAGPYLHVPIVEDDGSDDGRVFRVYPRDERGKPVRRADGVWCWSYR
jgi:hypothetical protein